MRNILEYPLVEEEVMASLDRAMEREAASRQIGGTTGWALSAIRAYLAHNPALVTLICQHDRESLVKNG
jgi:hypothetical protein